MDTLASHNEKKPANYKGYVIGGLIGLAIVAAGVWLLLQRPSMEDQQAAVLEGAYKEGSPEFEEITKDIITSNSRDTVESPNAFGAISMFIKGNIYNKGDKTITGLELSVRVVDTNENIVKEKRVLAIPTQRPRLEPKESIPVTLSIDGFKREDDRANIRWKVTAIRIE